MRYLIIGLGIYGSNLAIDLTRMGHEVIGADSNPSLVESIKDSISTAYIIDSTEEVSLGMLPLKNVDLVIVAIGENFGASVKTVALLKKLGVKHIYARAADPIHQSILDGMHVDRILTPEQRAATDLVNEIELGVNVESLKIDPRVSVIKFEAPQYFQGVMYADLNLADRYGLELIAVTRQTESRNAIGMTRMTPKLIDTSSADLRVAPGDIFVCLGSASSYRALYRDIESSR